MNLSLSIRDSVELPQDCLIIAQISLSLYWFGRLRFLYRLWFLYGFCWLLYGFCWFLYGFCRFLYGFDWFRLHYSMFAIKWNFIL